ncbi:MAG TPA: HDOD domain-containing protein [Rhodocyclaceae bacterium]|nr:HDOD domain-containing protein [Rhodocyclaceae bacterium]
MASPIDLNRFEQLRASGELPSPRGVALAIIRLMQQEEVSITELARVISGDPAFVGRVLKAANGLIGFSRRPVLSVNEALMVLGLPAVRSMALGFSLLSDYRDGGCRGFDYDLYWASSLALALGMQAFAQRTRAAAADEMFSLGLLLRVGELALATLYPDAYGEVLEQASAPGERSLAELEQAAFAMTHADLGMAMLSDWGLPAPFIELVACHDDPGSVSFEAGSRQQILLDSLVASRRFAQLCVAGRSARQMLLAQLLEDGGRLGLDRDDVHDDARRMYALWGEWGELLQLATRASEPFPELAAHDVVEPALAEDRSAPPGAAVGLTLARRAASAAGDADGGAPAEPFVMRALVADDDEPTRAAVAAFLRGQGHEVFEAECCSRLLERALELQPQMVVAGCALGDGPGLAGVRALRKMRIGAPIYVLLVTNGESEQDLVEAFEAGVDDFVGRQAGRRVLAARLHAGLRELRQRRELERDREELRRFATELAVSNRRLQEAALTDMLTGFRNRRYAIDRIEQEWAQAERSGRPLSCLVIDLDGLKEINDSFGHGGGDQALAAAARALRGELRGNDVICRMGGDEFLAICPGSGLDAALACAERLRRAVGALVLEIDGQAVPLTVSIGAAEKTRSVVDADGLVKLADQGAYRAKHAGRNAVAAVQRHTDVPCATER